MKKMILIAALAALAMTGCERITPPDTSCECKTYEDGSSKCWCYERDRESIEHSLDTADGYWYEEGSRIVQETMGSMTIYEFKE